MKYFGTDGIRGKFGKFPIVFDFFVALAGSIERFFSDKTNKKNLRICIGRDTRFSGLQLFDALTRGFSENITILDCKVLPTPAIAETTIKMCADVGIAITASHNRATDNGIKIFDSDGEKLTTAEESKLEEIVESFLKKSSNISEQVRATVCDIHQIAKSNYCQKYKTMLSPGALVGKTIVFDSANGATYDVAKTIFEYFGGRVIQIGCSPDGYNINENCGSENIGNLSQSVVNENAFIGIANDGDGDRVVILDEYGEKLDGDIFIGIIAQFLKKNNQLPNNAIVVTIPSNLALDIYLKNIGIDVIRCDVGDRNVYQAMLKNDCFFGGENSGHLIFRKFSKIGDGITAAIYLISILLKEKINLSKIKSCIALFPQKSFNIAMTKKIPVEKIGNLKEEIAKIKAKLPLPSRVVTRYSGTEPKLKVFVESPDQASVDHAWGKLKQSMIENIKNDLIS